MRADSVPRYASKTSRSSSAVRIRDRARARQLGFDLPGQLGQIGDQVDRGIAVDVVRLCEPLELVALPVQLREQLLRAGERVRPQWSCGRLLARDPARGCR